ncbi:MAG: isoprenylcysteine carboxylmethyltransferase family protein [Candidatus Omnitrophota bacterium]
MVSTFCIQKSKQTKCVYYEWLFKLVFYGYIAIVIFSVGEFFFMKRSINPMVSLSGGLCFVVGMILRRKAMSALGENWGLKTEIKDGHSLVETGIYRYLKHPYYLAVVLELTGICLVANSYYSLILVYLFQGPLLLIRIYFEEKILLSYLGEAYKKYVIGKIF